SSFCETPKRSKLATSASPFCWATLEFSMYSTRRIVFTSYLRLSSVAFYAPPDNGLNSLILQGRSYSHDLCLDPQWDSSPETEQSSEQQTLELVGNCRAGVAPFSSHIKFFLLC